MLWASLNLEDAAQLSYMRLAREEGNQSWRRFSELLNTRFGPPLRSHPLGEVSTCRRNSEVTEYQDRFLGLLVRASTLSEFQQVQLFTVGLGEPLSIDVQMQNPQTPEVAMNLARSFEQRELVVAQATRLQHQGILPTPTTRAAGPKTQRAGPDRHLILDISGGELTNSNSSGLDHQAHVPGGDGGWTPRRALL